jgi:glycosyltransferase involved in cell wall biosynthesis
MVVTQIGMNLKIVVGWNGLPAYGAKLIQAAREDFGCAFPVLGTKPDVPIEGMEQIIGDGLVWLEAGQRYTWDELGLAVPDLFIHTGWGYPHFISLANEVRSLGGKVVGMFDNCWKGDFRQFFGGLYFRLFMRRKYHAAWVPGQSGLRLARYLGFKTSSIYPGMYGSSDEIFNMVVPMVERQKQILFVGLLDHRKGILELVEAYSRVKVDYPDWNFLVVGNGPLTCEVEKFDGIELLPFQQPEAIAALMNRSRVFALASREEHWGLVVHEAALCGCALLLQSHIGAVADLSTSDNAVLFSETAADEIEVAMREIFEWGELEFNRASLSSLALSSGFGPRRWVRQFKQIIESISK